MAGGFTQKDEECARNLKSCVLGEVLVTISPYWGQEFKKWLCSKPCMYPPVGFSHRFAEINVGFLAAVERNDFVHAWKLYYLVYAEVQEFKESVDASHAT